VSGLQVLDSLEPALLRLDARELLQELARPTLARLPGTGSAAPRAVVVLQHGDEHTGIDALLEVLRTHPPLPFDLHVLFGNVTAALAPPGFAHRMLPGQPDMNRAWRADGSIEVPDDALSVATREALRRLRSLDLAAAVDLHNTTGANPFHAIVSRPDPVAIEVAALFTTMVVVWDQRKHTLMEALSDHCPTVAVECGLAGPPASHAFAVDGLRRFLGVHDPRTLRASTYVDVLGRMRRVEVEPGVRFRFGGELDPEVDLVIAPDADRRNGVHQRPGWTLGRYRTSAPPLRVLDVDGADVTASMLAFDAGTIRVTAAVTPLMMTRTVAAAQADCLTYLLTRLR
jgi:hypothetical protein